MRQAIEALLNATVRVGDGTGVVVRDDDGGVRVLTAQHVVAEKSSVEAWTSNGRRFRANVLAADETADVAVLDDGSANLDSASLPLGAVDLGEDVWLAGYPGARRAPRGLLVRGIVAGFDEGRLWLNIDATWGNSGSPVVTIEDGRLVRVVGILAGNKSKVHERVDDLRVQAKQWIDEAAERRGLVPYAELTRRVLLAQGPLLSLDLPLATVGFSLADPRELRSPPRDFVELTAAVTELGFETRSEPRFQFSLGDVLQLLLQVTGVAGALLIVRDSIKACKELPEQFRKLRARLVGRERLLLGPVLKLDEVHRWLDKRFGVQNWQYDPDAVDVQHYADATIYRFREERAGVELVSIVRGEVVFDVSDRFIDAPSSPLA